MSDIRDVTADNACETDTTIAQKTWINPIGGMGDTLMISGVLKLVNERDPNRRFNLIRRTTYLDILKGHPAIDEIGHPPRDASIIGTDYWSHEGYIHKGWRAFQTLAHMFGLELPVPERLYLPGTIEDDPILYGLIPWKKRNILIAPVSASPRKEMDPMLWHRLVDILRLNGAFVAQVGKARDVHIRNAYSLLGVTTQRQLIGLLRRFDVVVTSDNFIMHAAYLMGVPAVVLWGPTRHEVYGYRGHVHLQSDRTCGDDVDCIGYAKPNIYDTRCPLGDGSCMNQTSPDVIFNAITSIRKGHLNQHR
ncbi:MAG: hypothetical protein HQL03_02335 [Nitrospirae bacterium]|nr:hypothetical protein [Nitrospirota bacterium]